MIGLVVFGAMFYLSPDKTSDITKKTIDKGSSVIRKGIDDIKEKVDETKGISEDDKNTTTNPDRIYMGKPDCKSNSDCYYVEGCNDECICDKASGECYTIR